MDEKQQRGHRHFLRVKLIMAAMFYLPLLYLTIAPMLWWLPIPMPGFLNPMQYPLPYALAQIGLALPIILLGIHYILAGFQSFFQGNPDMNSVIAIGATTSLSYSLYSTYQIIAGNFAATDGLYFILGGAIITAALLGNLLEANATGRVWQEIYARKSESLEVNEEAETGSAIDRIAGDEEKIQHTTVRVADAIAGYYVPVVCALGAIAVGAWILGGHKLTFVLTGFFSMLLISCPSAIGIASSAAISAGLQKGRGRGILIKDGAALESIRKIDTVVLGEIQGFSAKAVQSLKSLGLEVILLSSDPREVAEAVAGQMGIAKVLADVPPIEKHREIARLQSEGRKVAVVSADTWDASALACADIGIAFGSGSRAVQENADIILTRSDLMDVPAAIQISKKTARNICDNLFWAFGYHVAGLAVAAGLLQMIGGPMLNPVLATAAMMLGIASVLISTIKQKSVEPSL